LFCRNLTLISCALEIFILDHCNVFYALARSSADEEIELIVREKTRQEREQQSNCPLISTGHNQTPGRLRKTAHHSRQSSSTSSYFSSHYLYD